MARPPSAGTVSALSSSAGCLVSRSPAWCGCRGSAVWTGAVPRDPSRSAPSDSSDSASGPAPLFRDLLGGDLGSCVSPRLRPGRRVRAQTRNHRDGSSPTHALHGMPLNLETEQVGRPGAQPICPSGWVSGKRQVEALTRGQLTRQAEGAASPLAPHDAHGTSTQLESRFYF